MSGVRAGRVVKPGLKGARRSRKSPVLRMMAIMQDGNNSQEEVPKEFLDTGRTGRRNAMPDILTDAQVTTADLPTRLQMLATTDPDSPQPGPSNTDVEKSDEAKDKKNKAS